jgi:hypothetical protein
MGGFAEDVSTPVSIYISDAIFQYRYALVLFQAALRVNIRGEWRRQVQIPLESNARVRYVRPLAVKRISPNHAK